MICYVLRDWANNDENLSIDILIQSIVNKNTKINMNIEYLRNTYNVEIKKIYDDIMCEKQKFINKYNDYVSNIDNEKIILLFSKFLNLVESSSIVSRLDHFLSEIERIYVFDILCRYMRNINK